MYPSQGQPSGFYDAPPPQQAPPRSYAQPQAAYQYPTAGSVPGFGDASAPQAAAPNLDFYSSSTGGAMSAGAGGMGMGMDMMMSGGGQMGAPPGALGGSPSGGGFQDEPPLLEELGINFTDIRNRMLYVLLPSKKLEVKALEDTDLAGPVLFAMALGVSLMLTGKLHFGFIYGCSLMGSVFVWTVLNLMHAQGIDMYRVCSVLGYGLVPIVLLALVNVGLDLKGHAGLVLSFLAILWCSFSASRFFERILDLSEQRWLVAYPLCLVYTCFALITVF